LFFLCLVGGRGVVVGGGGGGSATERMSSISHFVLFEEKFCLRYLGNARLGTATSPTECPDKID